MHGNCDSGSWIVSSHSLYLFFSLFLCLFPSPFFFLCIFLFFFFLSSFFPSYILLKSCHCPPTKVMAFKTFFLAILKTWFEESLLLSPLTHKHSFSTWQVQMMVVILSVHQSLWSDSRCTCFWMTSLAQHNVFDILSCWYYINTFFFVLRNIIQLQSVYNLLIHLPHDGHLGCFQV